jgi:hypothetical protein
MRRLLCPATIAQAVGFDPRDVSGLRAWFSVDDLGAVGGACASWASRVGGFAAVQADAAKKPVIASVGARKALAFDASDDVLSAGDVCDMGANNTLVVAVVANGSFPANNVNGVVCKGTNATAGTICLLAYDAYGSNKTEAYFAKAAGDNVVLGGTAKLSGTNILMAWTERATYRVGLRENATESFSSNSAADSTSRDNNSPVQIGQYSTLAHGSMTIGDILIYQRAGVFTVAERAALYNWLKLRWAL